MLKTKILSCPANLGFEGLHQLSIVLVQRLVEFELQCLVLDVFLKCEL